MYNARCKTYKRASVNRATGITMHCVAIHTAALPTALLLLCWHPCTCSCARMLRALHCQLGRQQPVNAAQSAFCLRMATNSVQCLLQAAARF